MRQYLDLLQDVFETGVSKTPSREGLPGTREVFGRQATFDLSKGFPLLTTKKTFFKGILTELLWFLRGDTNIRFLLENNVHIWDGNGYEFYKKHFSGVLSKEEWQKTILSTKILLPIGNLGKIYGHQWRHFGGVNSPAYSQSSGGFDQVAYCFDQLKNHPSSRQALIDAWNPEDFFGEKAFAALPACHVTYTFNVVETGEEKILNLSMHQRSCDLFLGVPFNWASSALLLLIFATTLGYTPGKLVWFGDSVHIYDNHLDAVRKQLNRKPLDLPQVVIKTVREKPWEYELSDFSLENYQSYPPIKAEMAADKF